jgi:hypothetical protein
VWSVSTKTVVAAIEVAAAALLLVAVHASHASPTAMVTQISPL